MGLNEFLTIFEGQAIRLFMENSSSQEISKPPSDLFSFMIGWENIPLWIPDVNKFEPLDGDEGVLNSTAMIHLRFGGSQVRFLQRITQLVENRSLAFSWTNFAFEITHAFDFLPIGDDHTKLVSAMTVQPRNLIGNLLLPFFHGMMKKQQIRSLDRLNDAIRMVTPA